MIAGLHMGMVAGICFFALRAAFALVPAIALRFPTKKWAAALALLLTFFYMLLSGATVSSRRAFVMIGLVLLAVLAFTPLFGPLRILFRGVLILGVVALALSYVWPWLWPLVKRFRPKD